MKCYQLLVFLTMLQLSFFKTIAQQRFDVVINEIMVDPSPQIGLPNVEYIELKNVSGKDINMKGWRIAANTTSAPFPDYVLAADSLVILSTNNGASLLAAYGATLGIGSFPSLPNDGATIMLISNQNAVIHFVSYDPSWFGNEIKEEGGWSIEMMDAGNPCAGRSNWTWSANENGGTPGKKNAAERSNKDEAPPHLQNISLKDERTVVLQFDEPADSMSAAQLTNFTIAPPLSIAAASVVMPHFSEVELQLSSPLTTAIIYDISISGIKDCAGNEMSNSRTSIGLPENAAASDVVINEILFNPRSDASDYVELYNRSKKIIDVSKLYIANRSNTRSISSSKKISEKPFYLFPGDYIVITEDADALQKTYLVKQLSKVLTIASMPSFADDKGTVVLADVNGSVIDEVAYADDWHFGLIKDAEGIALERIDPDKPSQNANNWHSAASTAGYGTPTYRNSQYNQTETSNAVIEITPKVFSPDNDGFEDLATIQYKLEETGYVANISIYDATGKLVRHLVKNATLSLSGSWKWDGLNEKGQKLPVGTYIVYTEMFNLQGKKKSFKNVVVLARKLR